MKRLFYHHNHTGQLYDSLLITIRDENDNDELCEEHIFEGFEITEGSDYFSEITHEIETFLYSNGYDVDDFEFYESN